MLCVCCSYVTVDGWTDLQDELDDRNMEGSRIYTIIFIFLGHFIFTNVFIGVIIMNISEATESYKQELLSMLAYGVFILIG